MKCITAIAVASGLFLAGCTSADTGTTDQGSLSGLAQLDGIVDPSPSQLAPYQSAMNSLAPKCEQGRAKLVRLAWAGHLDLAAHHKDESGLQVLQHLNQSVAPLGYKIDCQGVLATFLVLVEGGQSSGPTGSSGNSGAANSGST